MKKLQLLSAIFISSITLFSCSDDDDTPVVINEEEVITTMNVTLTSGSQTITLQSQDLDGDGPDDPVITVDGNFAANATYNGTIQLLNETEDPAEDVTEEVEEENLDHQFFYIATGEAIASTTYDDIEDEGNPVGVHFILTTGEAGDATLQIVLKHEPEKDAEGVSDGDMTNAGGETDFDATFPITVE
ncbi:hypothetical protein SAMN05216480_11523 [Pustulibacterium marinum]|uniref:Type 1 periplasmic binding fold superfamily protein n=1 Tax=Pustulibacterium marinum TaxID=1224947 RepID=A0A1I7IDH6_9FLAO|nr:type 1 periplasmic binding fold superfamily protein [Pustulibacterium marinum]SFU70900.1 hypothetical protein SAMN05216480_11523 [Pustulibacterium marinum]